MIVKNESAIIERCLLSVLPFISCYVIGDTGSNDDTVSIIRQTLSNLPGEIHTFGFIDFSQARNQALELCLKSNLIFDYVLLIDADMELKVLDLGFTQKLTASSYAVKQISGTLAYHNVRLLSKDSGAYYVGYTHEYISTKNPPIKLSGIEMLDHACGSNRSSKYERDYRLLSRALEENPRDARSLFYLAQTLRESGKYQDAIEVYNKRINLGGWDEEIWYSKFMLAKCYLADDQPEKFIAECLDAYQYRPQRAEPLHALANHYRLNQLYEASALFCQAGLAIDRPPDLLFVDEEVYSTSFRFELSISGYYCASPKLQALARRYAKALGVDPTADPKIRETARSNWRHYAKSAGELLPSALFRAIEHKVAEGFYPCNPSLAWLNGKLYCILRSVNYHIKGANYCCAEDGIIRTQNFLLKLHKELAIATSKRVKENPPLPAHPNFEGLEDIRLIDWGGQAIGSATLPGYGQGCYSRMAIFELDEDGVATSLSVQDYRPQRHEKNWVPLVIDNKLGFIYQTSPTTVLRWDPVLRQCLPWRTTRCPLALEHLRGSSQALAFDGGWLYVTHEVSWDAKQVRTYLHRFVKLDAEFKVCAISEPFYFRTLGIEFCCGMVEDSLKGKLLLSFGVNDSQAWILSADVEEVRQILEPCS